jgi:serine/threonine protein kinase/Tol biopolymer transport system component
MPLTSGTRLGPYEILGTLGAGGMGEVYKARDTRLERVVALKVIQSAFAASSEMRERFEREARAISALDHPNICILHDVCRLRVEDASAGQGRGEEVSFLVMQYLEGETLADRLTRAGRPISDPTRPSSGSGETSVATVSRGPIPLDTALKFATEIASALDAAHRRGVVHRDLKPGNVMLTKTGTKLLDFGLAKLAAKDDAGVFGGDGATRTSPLTSQGAILGTLYYMSPEQLEGRNVDARSDIHAFGAVLFEMLTGRRAFEGQSQAGVITAIVGGDPPTVTQLADTRTSLPRVAQRALDRLLAKCFAKNPDERWQSAADLADELRWINEERARPLAESEPPVLPVIDRSARTRERIWMGVAGAAVIAAAVMAYAWFPRATRPPGPVTFTIEPPAGATLASGPGLLAISPDGARLAFATGDGSVSGRLWVRELASLVPVRLDRGDGAWQPLFSPDGQSLSFLENRVMSALRRLDLAGGPTRTVAAAAAGRIAWAPGVVLFVGSDNRLYRVPDVGGKSDLVMDLDSSQGETALFWPTFLPDGQRYLFVSRGKEDVLYTATLGSPGRTRLMNVLSTVDYSGGYLFYQRDGTLMAHPFDAAAGRLTGDAFPVVEDIRYNVANGRAAFAVSASGTLSYVPGGAQNIVADRRVLLFDQKGTQLRQIGGPGAYQSAVLSPDGRQAIVTVESGQPAVRSLWLLDMSRGVLTRFTVGTDDERSPVWSPKGDYVVFESRRPGARGLYRRASGGGATTDELLYRTDDQVTPTGFSSDGQRVLMTVGSGAGLRVWVLPLTGDRKPVEAFPGTTAGRLFARFSPDDKWIAYTEFGGPGEAEVYLEPHPADGRRVQISTAGGRHPMWTDDGHRVIYRATDNALMAASLADLTGMPRPSTPVKLFTRPRLGLGNWTYSMDSRGERFLLLQPPEKEAEAPAVPITVILNFVQNLQKK